MALTDNIKVDLYGQYNNNTEHAYSYPDKITNQYSFTANTAWAAAITDPRALFQSICKAGPCYQIYRHRNGYYFSLIVRNQADSRSGLEMVTIFIPSGYYASGLSILAALNELKVLLISRHCFDDNLVASCVSNIKESHSHEWFPSKEQENPSGQHVSVYRTYKNEPELAEIFTFLKQKDYANIDKLLVVSESDVKDGVTLQRVGSSIRRLFNVVPTKDATSNLREVSAGEKFTITLLKDGFESHTIEEELNPIQSRYYRISGNDVYLLSPSDLRVSFNKRMYFRLESEEGPAPNSRQAEVVFDGHVADKDTNGRPFVLVPEDAVFPGSKASVQVSAPNYEPLQTTVLLENLTNNASVPLRLKPKKRRLRICFHFGDSVKGENYFPSVELPFNETDPMLDTVMIEQNFYGYSTYQLHNGDYRVDIPWGHHRRYEREEKKRRVIPNWLKIVLFSLIGILVALALFLGGYAVRNFTDIHIPGLYSKPAVTSHAGLSEPEHPSRQMDDYSSEEQLVDNSADKNL